jgi:hypothetical protein
MKDATKKIQDMVKNRKPEVIITEMGSLKQQIAKSKSSSTSEYGWQE